MFKKIIGTIGAKVITTLLAMLIVVINARYLGASKVGTINLIIPAIMIINLVNNFVGGPALVYLLPRTDIMKLLVPSYLWAVISSAIVTVVLQLLSLIPEGFFVHVMILSFILSMYTINFLVLLGKENIRAYNTIALLQMFLQLLLVMAIFFLFNYREVMGYILALYASYIFAFIYSSILVIPLFRKADLTGMKPVLKEIFRFGTVMQTGNIVQMLNYRASYYFLESFFSRAMVGIYAVGVQVSEGIWLVARSIAMVQYTRISNENDRKYAARLTLNLVKMTLLLTLVILGALLVLPTSVYTFIFGKEFYQVKLVMVSLTAGILLFSISIILSPFFSGIGKPRHNTIASLIGLVFTILLCILLIPRMGMVGAGLAASASYASAMIYQGIMFVRFTGITWRNLRITREEIRMVVSEVRKNFM
jgi:O-antigen/teichoic acid export membrane protein